MKKGEEDDKKRKRKRRRERKKETNGKEEYEQNRKLEGKLNKTILPTSIIISGRN